MDFQKKIIQKLKQDGFLVIKTIRLSEAGYPDLIFLKNGKTYFIEIKKNGDTLKPLQKLRIDELMSQGFEACCLHETKGIIYGKISTQIWNS